VTVSVASAVAEDICLKTKKTPYFGRAVPTYVKLLTVIDTTNVFLVTFRKII
jgi:hypothetical protein